MHMAPVGAPAGARLFSAAPGPAPSEASADIVFTVTAQAAVLTSSSLTLTNVPAVVQSFSYESKTGIYTTGAPLTHTCRAKSTMNKVLWEHLCQSRRIMCSLVREHWL